MTTAKTTPSKLKMHTPDLTQENIAKIAALFPNCVTEAAGDNGTPRRAIDFDLLRQELSDHIVEGPQERYHLNWPGKREALLAANAPIAKTLRPCREESVDFDTTKNLFIEGDNLDALKLLQETYLNRVKMIYIDPPYNTGNDFVYADDFASTTSEYLARSDQRDAVGNRLVANTESNGRFHSDWITMIYSRLRLARTLLSDKGVLFVSIDDGEVANLRKACDEVFGEQNLIAQICHKSRASVSNDKILSSNHNHILLYARSIEHIHANRAQFGLAPDLTGFDRHDDRGAYKLAPVDGPGGASKGNPHYEFLGVTQYFRFSKETMTRMHKEGRIVQTASGLQQKYYLEDAKKKRRTVTTWWDEKLYTSSATGALNALLGAKCFDSPKHVDLIRRMIAMAAREDGDIVMDFFAGSCTTAHATMLECADDGVRRRFIMVQIPEPCPDGSPAAKAGYRDIAQIGKERIRRAGSSIADERGLQNAALDTGFRVLKIDSSNMKDVYYRPDETAPALLDGLIDNIKEDRTDEDLLFQVLLDWGVDLALPIKRETIRGKPAYFVDENALAACFAAGIDDDFVKELAARKPLRVVFRDAGYGRDDVKINVEQIFKQMSPGTEVKTL